MSKYTTEVRFICEEASGLLESKGYNDIESIIAKAIPKIFNFNFPIFDENYRSVLETKILKHFYTREICEETVGLWKLRLNSKLNEIMPYYNKLYESELIKFNPLYTVNLNKRSNTNNDTKHNEKEISKNTDNKISNKNIKNTGMNTENSNFVGSSNSKDNGSNSNTHYDLYSDTPQGALNGVDTETYLTNARKITDNGSNSNTSNSNNISNQSNKAENIEKGVSTEVNSGNNVTDKNNNFSAKTIEMYLENVNGYNGVSGSKLLLEYRETFINIDMQIIKELEPLFFNLW